jgi:hypothetical protein
MLWVTLILMKPMAKTPHTSLPGWYVTFHVTATFKGPISQFNRSMEPFYQEMKPFVVL